MHKQHWRGRLEVATEFGSFLGDTRIRLLEAIDRHGSISKAAKTVPLSYKAAWDAIDVMNNLADEPLVIRSAGGKQGGGTLLTDYGQRVVALYRALEMEYQSLLDRLSENMHNGNTKDIQQFRQLLRRMSMKSSARNQFAGKICALKAGVVDFEVRIQVDATCEIVSVITQTSAENLGLQIGMEVYALVKSSSVILLTDSSVKVSARNQLWGEIVQIHQGPVSAEVVLALPGGKHLCAVVTHDSIDNLGLQTGQQACALFKASSVILCTYGA